MLACGGLLVHDSGRIEPVGALAGRPRVRLPQPAWVGVE